MAILFTIDISGGIKNGEAQKGEIFKVMLMDKIGHL